MFCWYRADEHSFGTTRFDTGNTLQIARRPSSGTWPNSIRKRSLTLAVQKNSHVRKPNSGNRMLPDQSIYPKKLGILIPRSSQIDFTMKFGALPM